MSTHNIGFYEDLTKIIFELSSNIIKYAPYFFCCFMKLMEQRQRFLLLYGIYQIVKLFLQPITLHQINMIIRCRNYKRRNDTVMSGKSLYTQPVLNESMKITSNPQTYIYVVQVIMN